MALQELVIDRSGWLLPETSKEFSCLLAADGKMCCLGFHARSLGVNSKKLEGEAYPADLVASAKTKIYQTKMRNLFLPFIEEGSYRNSWISSSLTVINDTSIGNYAIVFDVSENESPILVDSQKTREKLIKKYFKYAGVKVKFVGKLDLLQKNEKSSS